MLTRRERMSEELQAHVAKGQTIVGRAETRLHGARADITSLEKWVKQAHQMGMVNGTQAMGFVSRLGQLAGDIAAVEEKLYIMHAQGTELAKAADADVIGGYKVLAPFAPIGTMDGGGNR